MFFINRYGHGQRETVDQFETRKEAREMAREYSMGDTSARYWVSPRFCSGWVTSCPHCGRTLEGRELRAGLCSSNDCPRHDAGFFFVELTDTYGGEANYSWVRRFKVRASTFRGAISKAARETGYSGRLRKVGDYGDQTRHDVSGAAVCFFTEPYDKARHAQAFHVQTI